NYRIGVCSKIQWPDILYFDYSEKPYFVVTQPVLKKIFIYFINEDVFRYVNLDRFKNFKFSNPSKITKYKNDIYILDNINKTIVRLNLPENFLNEKVDFPLRR
ncbi:MAG: hypothetical protein N3E50_04645, partial [Candidatus Goldbacteria bacterium]|nr:hypothetical protein [Candidatus Goldiibacteriota bacterium]